MKTIALRFFFFTFTFILAVSLTSPAFAHGDEPRLEISADRMNPGGVMEVRGVDFEREELITLMLVGSKTAIPIGEISADVDGIFLQVVTLPVDLPEGVYNFLATTDDHNVASPDLTIQGSAVVADGEGGEGRRDQENLLLAPVPTYAPGVVPGGVAEVAAQPVEAPATSRDSMGFMGLILLVLGILAALGLRVAGKK